MSPRFKSVGFECCQPTGVSLAMENHNLELIQKRLENGLTVLIKPVPNKVVTVDVWVNTGSANELDSNNGISHFLEHMLFKGTPKYGVGDLDKVIMGVGGVWNAGTSKDYTHYHVTVAAPYFDEALDALSDMVQNALIDAGEFDREKQVILEEYRRKQDSPYGVLYDELYDACFSAGPYRRSVLGTFESISALNRNDMYDYYCRYYTPENMVLLVAGDVDPAATLPKIRQAFCNFSRTARPLEGVETTSIFQAGQCRVLPKDVNETYLGLAFPAPGIAERGDVFALDVASMVLTDGRSSRLYRAIKEEKRLVHSIGGGFPTHRYDSFFYIIATLEHATLEAAKAAIVSEMRNLAANPPTTQEMAKAKRMARNSFHFGMETNTGQTGTIGYYYTLTGSTEFLDSYLDRLDGVTPQDVANVAAKYFSAEPSSVVLMPDPDGGALNSDAAAVAEVSA